MASDRLKAAKKQLKAQQNTNVTLHSFYCILPAGLSDRNGYDVVISQSECSWRFLFYSCHIISTLHLFCIFGSPQMALLMAPKAYLMFGRFPSYTIHTEKARQSG